MLRLKRNILSVTKIHRVSVRNERICIADKWFYWDKENKLMHEKKDPENILKALFGVDFNSINFNYNYLEENLYSKN